MFRQKLNLHIQTITIDKVLEKDKASKKKIKILQSPLKDITFVTTMAKTERVTKRERLRELMKTALRKSPKGKNLYTGAGLCH